MKFQLRNAQDRIIGHLVCEPGVIFSELGKLIPTSGSPILVAYAVSKGSWVPFYAIRAEDVRGADEDRLPAWLGGPQR